MASGRLLAEVVRWLDAELETGRFSGDVSNNGLQIGRDRPGVDAVAFAVDASLAAVEAAIAARAQLLVVHHGISWNGGIRRLTGGVRKVAAAALAGDLALYAAHLPLDASRKCGNNWELARYFGLRSVRPAFAWRGMTIGVVGTAPDGRRVGIVSGGGGAFAEEAKELGCDLFVTGEADWGERIAAENAGIGMAICGHYETETFGVRALMRELRGALGLRTVFLARPAFAPLVPHCTDGGR